MTGALAAVCAATGLLLVWRGSPRATVVRRLTQLAADGRERSDGLAGRGGHSDRSDRASLHRWLATAALAIGCVLLVGAWVGAGLAVVVVVVLPRWLAAQEPAGVRRERQRREAELPLVLDVMAACVAAGATAQQAVAQVAEACRSTLGADLRRAASSLQSGATPLEAWRALPQDIAPIGEVLERSVRSGASSAALLHSLAARRRAERRASRLDAARRLGVHAAAPLGLCFLPGFVVLGLLPVIIGLVSQAL
jgi:pilus assembly protein TadC